MKEIKINHINGDVSFHTKTRYLSKIDDTELEEFGKCMFCSIEQSCQKICKGNKIYEEIKRLDSRGNDITE